MVKAKFVLELGSCRGHFNSEQHPKALGVHRNCSRTFRRKVGELHKNHPGGLDFNSKIPLPTISFAWKVCFPPPLPCFTSHSALRACSKPRACVDPFSSPEPSQHARAGFQLFPPSSAVHTPQLNIQAEYPPGLIWL